MTRLHRLFRRAAAAAAVLGLLSVTAQAQSGRSVRFIAPTPPAGVNDFMARLIADHLGKTQGIAATVENRAGAAEQIGTETVARAAPDGSTLLFASSQIVINPQLRKMNYHPLESFEPICVLVSAPTVFSVHPSSPYRTFTELLDAARAKPGSVTIGSIGPGTPFDIGVAVLKHAAKADITFVPFNGNGPSLNALLGQHLTSSFNSFSSASAQIKPGLIRPLAAAHRTRLDPLPQVPTVAELGFPGYEVTPWFGAYAPAKTPKEIVAQFADAFTAAMKDPDIKAKLASQELYPVGACGADAAAFLRKEYESYGRQLRDANFKLE